MKRRAKHVDEWSPVMACIGQVKMPDLIDLVRRGNFSACNHRQICKAFVFLYGPQSEFVGPAIVAGKTFGERENSVGRVKPQISQTLPQIGVGKHDTFSADSPEV